MINKKSVYILGLILSVVAIVYSCVDPVEPEFAYQDNIIFIEAYALTEPGLSSVSIKRSVFQLEEYRVEPVEHAIVRLENMETNSSVDFSEDLEGVYACPADFAAITGERWKLSIELEDGRKYESTTETVTKAIPIDNIEAEFSPEVKYEAGFGGYVPGHSIRIDFRDIAGEENFYLWKYRTYEPLVICKTCDDGIWRNDVCQNTAGPSWAPRYHDYLCETDCWLIRHGENLPIFDDLLSDGQEITGKEIAGIPYYRDQNILVEVQQLSLGKSAYDYFKIINDLVNENSGLNAPPPAALLGNLSSVNDPDDFVLGQFTATAVSTKRIFIDRSNTLATPIDPDHILRLEDCFNCPNYFPCEEGFFRTSIKPVGWP